MTQFLFFVSNFLDFWFLPFIIMVVVSIIIEQVLRSKGNEYDPKAVAKVNTAMGVRKYLIRQAWLFNIIWFVGYFIVMIALRGQQTPMPDMIWDGSL